MPITLIHPPPRQWSLLPLLSFHLHPIPSYNMFTHQFRSLQRRHHSHAHLHIVIQVNWQFNKCKYSNNNNCNSFVNSNNNNNNNSSNNFKFISIKPDRNRSRLCWLPSLPHHFNHLRRHRIRNVRLSLAHSPLHPPRLRSLHWALQPYRPRLQMYFIPRRRMLLSHL